MGDAVVPRIGGSRGAVEGTGHWVAYPSPLVDAAQIFDAYEHSHGRYFNEDLIVDDCHPSALGHRLIADALAPLLQPPPG